MKQLFQTVILTLLIVLQINAQTIDGAFVTMISPTDYRLTIAVNLQSEVGTAGVVSIEFTYNTADLSFPSSPIKNTDYTLHGFFDTWTTQNITRPSANAVRLSLLTTGTTSPPLVSLSTTPTDIITLNFTILNAETGQSQLVWVTTDIAPQFLSPNYTIGTWSNRNDSPIPVELSTFTADIVNETNVALSWETKTEVNNDGFEIQRKIDKDWQKIAFIPGHGTTSEMSIYHYTDDFKYISVKGIVQYRLKQIDFNGTYEYTDIVEVNVDFTPKEYVLYQNYPNPFNPATLIKYQIPAAGFVTLKLYDVLGNKVDNLVTENKEPGRYDITFDASALSSGVYIYQLRVNDYLSTKKMVLMK